MVNICYNSFINLEDDYRKKSFRWSQSQTSLVCGLSLRLSSIHVTKNGHNFLWISFYNNSHIILVWLKKAITLSQKNWIETADNFVTTATTI